MKKSDDPIICVGEILWDGLSEGLFLGGAPLNVCLNLNTLGVETSIISRVGDDRLGDEATARIRNQGIDTLFVQVDKEHETGFVNVELDEDDEPRYTFVADVAWDFIDLEKHDARAQLQNAWAVVFGTLAHRQNPDLMELCKLDCLKVMDMNLRAPHYRKEHVLELVEHADVVKMNEEELSLMQKWASLSSGDEQALRQLADRYGCSTLCVTCGKEGALLLHHDEFNAHPGYSLDVADTVGAGDAFLAAMLYGLQAGHSVDDLLPLANAAGAFVASKGGANPDYDISTLESVVHQQTPGTS